MSSRTESVDSVSAPVGGSELGKRGGIALVVSLLANGSIVGAMLATGAVTLFEPLAYGPVLFLSALGVVGATATYWVLARVSGQPDRHFQLLAGVVLLVSFVPDVTVLPGRPNATWPAIIVLMAMHVVVAAVVVWALVYWRRPDA